MKVMSDNPVLATLAHEVRTSSKRAHATMVLLAKNRAERISKEFTREMKLRRLAGVRLDGATIRPIKEARAHVSDQW